MTNKYELYDGNGNLVDAVSFTELELQERVLQRLVEINEKRRIAYINEADVVFFKAQRGEVTNQEWLDKVAEIRTRFPKV